METESQLDMQLRNYQRSCDKAIMDQFKTVRSTLACLPTGTGKTRIAAEVIHNFLPMRTMFMAHRRELLFQAQQTLFESRLIESDLEMGDLYADHGPVTKPVVLAMVQSLNSKDSDGIRRLRRFRPAEFGLLVIDEFHHGVCDSYKTVIEHFSQNPGLKILGLTATPDRLDEEALGQICESVAFDYEIMDAINDGWLVEPMQQFVAIEGLDFSHIKTTDGDFNGAELAEVMEMERNLQGVADSTLKLAGNRRTLVFTASVKQAEMLSDIFNRHRPGCSNWVCGFTNEDKRKQMLGQFMNGTIQFMVNCGVLTEGYDNPTVEVVVLARPTKSRALYSQMVGRSLRPEPGLVDTYNTTHQRIEAIASSSKKCIAEGQLILTTEGLVPIEAITPRMRVWDGVEFVTNSGIIYRGEQNIIEYAGLKATPDHKVWTEEGWEAFGECATKQIPLSVTAFGSEAIREADGYYRRDCQEFQRTALCADRMCVWYSALQRFEQCASKEGWLPDMWPASEVPKVVMGALRSGIDEMHEQERWPIQTLWSTRDSIQFPVRLSHGALGSSTSRAAQGIDTGQDQQQWRLRAREPALRNKGDSKQQPSAQYYARVARLPIGVSEGWCFRRSFKEIVKIGHNMEGYTVQAQTKRPIQGKAKVFDILNSGPRHRFTASGILVSNCALVLDFVGNSGRHKLVSVADLLGGEISDEAKERVVEEAKTALVPVQISKALAEADKQIAREAREKRLWDAARKAALVGVATYSVKTVSPFDVFDIAPVKMRGWDMGRMISDKERMFFLRQHIDPTGMSQAQRNQLRREMFWRWKAKMATIKQCALIKKHYPKQDTRRLTQQQASVMIDQLKMRHWKPIQ